MQRTSMNARSRGVYTQLKVAAEAVQKRRFKSKAPNAGNGLGGELLRGGMSTAVFLAQIAAKAIVPLRQGL